MIGVDNPQLDVRLVFLDQGAESVAKELAPLGSVDRPSGIPAAIVVPLLTGPHPATLWAIDEAVAAAGISVTVTDPLGPHPLLAEALHVRLAEAGLARVDRIRLFNVSAPIDGVIMPVVGGEAAVRAAEATAVLLAARLAVPVMPAALDGSPGVETLADRLRGVGATRIALAPCVVGPEVEPGLVAELAARAGAGHAAPLGAHPSLAALAGLRYGDALAEVEAALE
jgi:hypothetical protein